MWQIEFYVKPNGRCPVQEFLDNLSKKDDQPFVIRKFDLLAEFGHELRRPHTDYLRDEIWELRVHTRRGQLRFLYFYSGQTMIVVTHGFLKKSAAVPRVEIEQAITYRADYLSKSKGFLP
jgi:phage-related protein